MATNLVVPVVAGVALLAGIAYLVLDPPRGQSRAETARLSSLRQHGSAWTGADRVYKHALPEVGKKCALEQVKGYLGVPDDQTSNPEYRAWKRSRGV